MAITASVVDGKVVANYTKDTNTSNEPSNSINKDTFLQILVAEMQYQDPLEPSSNTEWVSQMATFSSIEELQNLGDTLSTGQATDLIGKRVIMAVANTTTGETQYVTGIVDCIEKQSDGIYLSINDYLYSMDDLYSVVDEDYYQSLTDKENITDTETDADTDADADSE